MIVSRRFRGLLPLLLVSAAPSALAQVPAPEPSATLPPIIYSLPNTPAPTPTPVATPTPSGTPAPAAAALPRVEPASGATPTSRATPRVRATPTPASTPTPSARAAAVAPTPSPTVAPVPVVTTAPATAVAPTSSASPGSEQGSGLAWYVPLGIVAALLAGGAWLWLRRRRPDEGVVVAPAAVSEREELAPSVAEAVVPVAAPRMLSRRGAVPAEPPAPVVAAERAWIELELRPRRAGLNLLTATADVDVLVRNRGTAEAGNVRIDARLTSARADQDSELGQIFAETRGRVVTPAFALAPGAERVVRALVTLPREAINVLTAAERPMFVPVVTLNVRYALGGGGEGQTAQAFALGIERAGSAKLAPFWLDAPSRMFETVAARPHALAITS